MNCKFLSKLMLLFMAIQFTPFSYGETIWIDVRSVAEYKVANIKGDINIPYTDIVKEIKKVVLEKNTEIHLYCRSGRRASVALSALKNAHYTNVSNEGEIDNVRNLRKIKN